MRTVLGTSSQTAHVWAQQTQEHGKSGHGNIYFNGPALYSYGSHFLLGYIMPDGTALLNSDSYSITTAKHKGAARGAVRHRTSYSVPKLTDMLYLLQDIASGQGDKARLKARMTAALYDRASDISDDSAAYLASLVRITAKQRESIKAKRAAADAKAKREAAKREAEYLLGDAKAFADMPLDAFRATYPKDGDSDWNKREYRAFGSRVAKLHRIAKAKLGARRTAAAWEKVKAWREHINGLDSRLIAAHLATLTAAFNAWQAGTAPRPDSWRYKSVRPELAGMESAILAAEQAEREAEARAEYDGWKRGERGRPERWIACLTEAEQAEIAADIAAELGRTAKAYEAWRDDRTQPRPDSMPFLSKLSGQYPNAWAELSAAENAEKVAQARAVREMALEAWRRGESRPEALPRNAPFPPHDDGQGGALLRVRGALLETSQGASVPLREAIAVFRFAKLCRERGAGWRRNGARLPVGHFAVDSIDADGSFRAGCHRINWPEIERAAADADVLALPASDAALER